ncbi:TPA: hypothetical protein DIS60_04150, partial [Patescibacteria group bacterium]|nr:hypothetical protein [Patescibacteria group bacterium]
MFRSARIKLTSWYLLIIMMISISFSLVIYRVLISEVERFARSQRFRIERQLQEGVLLPPDGHIQTGTLPLLTDPDLVEDTKHRLLFVLIIVNSGILVLSGGLGYILAGMTLKPIKEMMEEQNQFITDASHELRTPLTSLKSAIEVNVRDKHLTVAQAKKLLAENIKDVDKLQLLSDELLQLAQYQKPNGKTADMSLSLQSVVKKAIRNVEALAKAKSIPITNTVGDAILRGDSTELSDIFTILLDNAIKYGKENNAITIDSDIKNGWALISVTDKGIGIGKGDIPHIFDRFYRADTSRAKTKAPGFGLGLSIAKK